MECFWIEAEREIVYLKPHTKKMIYVKLTHMLLVIFFYICLLQEMVYQVSLLITISMTFFLILPVEGRPNK